MQDVIQNILRFFEGNPIFNLTSMIIAFVGTGSTAYFYFKSVKSKKPTYAIKTINIVKENVQKIETIDILHDGEKLENLSITKIALWNAGKETINFSDVAKSDPLRVVSIGDVEVLDAKILFTNNQANDFQIQINQDRKSILIKFDFFDFEEGVVLQLAHNSYSSNNIRILGSIKTVKKIVRRNPSFSPAIFSIIELHKNVTKENAIRRMGWFSIIGGSLFGILLGLLSLWLQGHPENNRELAFSVLCYLLICFGFYCVWFGIKLLRRKIPDGFDIFDEEV